MLDDAQKDRTAEAIAGGLGSAREDIQLRQLCHFFRADADYGRRVARSLNLEIDLGMLQQNQQDHPQPIAI